MTHQSRTMPAAWNFAYLLPHVAFREPIENEYLALVSPDDCRLKELSTTSRAVRRLVSRFGDQFGRKVQPSALLVRADAPPTVDFYAIASFRNVIAVSSIIDAWSLHLSGGSASYPLWSDYFDFYPFSVTVDGELIGKSVAITEIDNPYRFNGQKAPHLPRGDRMSFGTDELVLAGCLRQWRRRFIMNRKERTTAVLFRSLQIAYQASRLPAVGTRIPTIHDIGIGIALWVSAFEILSHPSDSKADLKTVVELLANATWYDERLNATRYTIKQSRVNLVRRLYSELYRARNDFLHGNPVFRGSVFASKPTSGPTLLHCAPLVYRAALMAFFPRNKQLRKKGDFAAALAARLRQAGWGSGYEKALWSCRPQRR